MSTPRDRIEAKLGLAGPPLRQVRDDPPRVPDHELVRRIGQGSYGEVWLARNALGTWRAVKIVYRDNFKDARPYEREFAGIRRFEPLSRANEGFVDILQVGRDDAEGWFYYVMELADGEEMQNEKFKMQNEAAANPTASDRQPAILNFEFYILNYRPSTLSRDLHQRGRLPLEECLELGLTLSLALGHLHRHGLIHRDVKPSNIIFVGGVPKLADIGLVTEASGANTFVGTEGFVPPEGPTSPQADIYALGKVLYEAAMGKDRNEFPEPFTQISTDRESVALMELNTILLRACAPDPKARYASAEEMHADLALLHSGGSVKRRHQFERQFRIAKQVGAAAITASLLIGAALFWQRQQAEKMTRLATEKSELADANARLASEKGAAASESRRRLIQTQTANGLRAMDENDPATAALWFAEVLQRSEGDANLERRQRERLAALFRHLPKPIARLSLEHGGASVRTSPDGRWIIGVGRSRNDGLGTGEIKIWDASSFRPLHSLVISNIWGNRVSPSGRWALVSDPKGNRLCAVLDGMRVTTPLPFGGHGEQSAFASDESKLAMTAWQGSEVQIIEIPSGRSLTPPLQHSNQVVKVAFDPTGRWLATGTEIKRETVFPLTKYRVRPGDPDVGQARVWEVATGQPVTDWIDVDDPGYGIEFTPDGSAVAVFGISGPSDISAMEQNSVKVIELPSGKARFAPLSHQNKLQSASFSPDGRYLATGTAERLVTIWNAQTGEAVHRALKHENGSTHLLRFSPDGAWLAVAGESEVSLWEVRSGKTVGPALKGGEGSFNFDYSSDGQRLITLTRSGKIRVWDLAGIGPALPPFLNEDGEPITSAVFSPDGKSVCTAGSLGILRIWDAVSGLPRGETLIPTNQPPQTLGILNNRASWSPDGTLLVVPSGDQTARVWDVATGRERLPPLRHQELVLLTEFSPDGKRLVTASQDFTARIWDATTGEQLTPPLQHSNWVGRARFSPDGRRVVTASHDGTARVWDASTGAPVSPPLEEGTDPEDGRPLPVIAVSFSPDGTRVAMGGSSYKATIRDAVTGQPVGVAMQHRSIIWTLRFSPDGRRLLTTSGDRTARVWDAGTGEPITPPLLHDEIVRSGDFSPDGLRVITGSDDRTARIWDATTGEPLGPAFRHEQAVLYASFSPDGRTVSTSSMDGSAQLWETGALDWTNDELAAAARLLAGSHVGSSERIETLEASQLEEAWRRVGSRLEGAANSSESAARWHRRRMISSERSRDWFAAEFHARRLIALQPGDTTARSGLARISDARPPARDPATPAELIDLSAFYNASLVLPWHGGPAGNHLAEVPQGIQRLAGTRFDVRGLVQVIGTPYGSGGWQYAKAVNGIRIDRKLERLHFLHSSQGFQPADGTRVGHYLVHFANGRREEIPIIYGRDARDWHEHPNVPVGVTDAVIAWKGSNPATKLAGTFGIRLFKRTWENPAPDVEITKVDFVAEHDQAHPFLVALTAE